MMKKIIGLLLCLTLLFTSLSLANNNLSIVYSKNSMDEYPLPPPMSVDMLLEESISRRMSFRYFTGEAVTDEELSTILWAAYGVTDNGNRSIFNPDGTYSTIIYVIRSDATYKYVPENHSLSLFLNGNYLNLGQYTSPIKFGLVWDMNIEPDESRGMADIGMICQNIYLDANALNLGTVTTGMYVEDLYQLGIPSNEKPEIIMPLGNPSSAYDFTYNPLPSSNLPTVENNSLTLEDSINYRLITDSWDDSPISLLKQSQLIWSSYGYSYLYDNINNKRHRTVPSAIAFYPYKIFAANHSGVYQYNPSTHSITQIISGDQRDEIKDCVEHNNIMIDSASFIIIPCLDTNIGSSQYLRFWYYENGAIINNILLEAAALDLSGNVIYEISDESGLRSALGISSQTNLRPLSVVPVGNSGVNPNNPPIKPDIDGETQGTAGDSYTYTFNSVDPDNDNVYYYVDWGDENIEDWIGPYDSGETVSVDHTWDEQGTYNISAKAKDIFGRESEWSILEITMPINQVFNEFPILKLLRQIIILYPEIFGFLSYILNK